MSNTTTVTTKGQIVIPVAIRRRHGIRQGMKVRLVEQGDDIVIRAVSKEAIARLAGVLPSRGNLEQELRRDHAADRRREARRR
jgi:AbrB family looped-hinge helix DNA binding protein